MPSHVFHNTIITIRAHHLYSTNTQSWGRRYTRGPERCDEYHQKKNCAVLEQKSRFHPAVTCCSQARNCPCVCVLVATRGTCVLLATSDCRLLALLYHGANSTDCVDVTERTDWLCFKRLVVKICVAFGCECVRVCDCVCLRVLLELWLWLRLQRTLAYIFNDCQSKHDTTTAEPEEGWHLAWHNGVPSVSVSVNIAAACHTGLMWKWHRNLEGIDQNLTVWRRIVACLK